MTDQVGAVIRDLRVKYRPRRFRHLAQGLFDPTVRSITLTLKQRRELQALLLRGGYGEGKTTLARLLGARAACLRQRLHPFEPCGSCDGCQAVRRHPRDSDLQGYSEFDAQSASPREMINRIMDSIPFSKSGGNIMPQRVATLDEFHRLPGKDQEKFVKVIEDMGARYHTLFVLCVSSDANVCPAIVQRCTQRRLRAPSVEKASRHLRVIARAEGYFLTNEHARLLAASARCVPRVYVDLLQDALIHTAEPHTVTREGVVTACEMLENGR